MRLCERVCLRVSAVQVCNHARARVCICGAFARAYMCGCVRVRLYVHVGTDSVCGVCMHEQTHVVTSSQAAQADMHVGVCRRCICVVCLCMHGARVCICSVCGGHVIVQMWCACAHVNACGHERMSACTVHFCVYTEHVCSSMFSEVLQVCGMHTLYVRVPVDSHARTHRRVAAYVERDSHARE